MFLEKLEIQGFKSFANKNILKFPGMLNASKRGITGVVGPNGSGKSNVADAVRWALGEQSMKTLRGKKAEDIIFSGSDKKGKLGMAEVSLVLNNESKQAPIDYSEVIITRRLYRNGDSEYMLNNSRVRLADIQMLLARSKFGQKTYSVIGQGMVEGFLNTSLAERKEFFDEATGVRQYQIKRDDSLNKLKASYENLVQVQMLTSEIEPRLRSLTRQVNRLKKRAEIERELKTIQIKFFSITWHNINKKFFEYNNRFLEVEKTRFGKDKKLAGLNNELEKLKIESEEDNNFEILQSSLSKEQENKDGINRELARLEARMEIKLEASGQFDLSFLLSKSKELANEIKSIEAEIKTLKINLGHDIESGNELNQKKEKIDKEIGVLNKSLAEAGQRSEDDSIVVLNNRLRGILDKLKNVHEETDFHNIKKLILEIKKEIQQILSIPEQTGGITAEEDHGGSHFKEIHSSLNDLAREKEEALKRINENNLRVSARTERVKLLEEKKLSLAGEIDTVERKIKKSSGNFNIQENRDEKERMEKNLAHVEQKISSIKDKINELNISEEKKRNKLFALQKELSGLQGEINNINTELNEYKINSTRYETKLENLEIEIRDELGGLSGVKKTVISEDIDMEAAHVKIKQLKRQMELIGGIDPQIENEYNETKERYDFLTEQVSDLDAAIESLQKVIKELDITIKERFDKEFKLIADKFQKYFKILFKGGNAKIVKVIEDEKKEKIEEGGGDDEAREEKEAPNDTMDLKKIKFLQKHNATGLAGIEIHATPPGKKITTVTMLSGGERALTAIALICAIISASPSPFVVLDEVDAALDEANSERLAKILDELSHKTQFIVITHNRATMRRANILYGITMGDDGVSRLLSIKLDDANAVAGKY